MAERLLDIAGHRIAASAENEDRGGTPIVFLHGITASIDFWGHSLPAAIRDERFWISLSLPGHYPSRLPPAFSANEVTTEMFATVHSGAIRQLVGDRKVALVGWSTGGFSALNLAARHPECVASVMSICGFAKGAWWGVIGHMQRLVSIGGIGRGIFNSIWTQMGRRGWLFDLSIGLAAANGRAFRGSPVTRPTLDGWQHAVRHHDLAGLAVLFERLADLDIRPLLPSIPVPTLIVGGDRDPYIPLDHTRSLASAIPGAELRVFSRTGHMFFAESTAAYQELLTDWLSRPTVSPPAPITDTAPLDTPA
jgi:pimeloyl-ACP methyl ester carboxylesterase